jgi:serine protease AprX
LKRRAPLHCILAAILLLASPAIGAARPASQATVQPQVWQILAAEGQADVLVVLRAQADLSGASRLPTKEAKGRYVYEQLSAVAREGQRELRAALDAQDVDYQSFAIVDAILIRADTALVESMAGRSDVARIVSNPQVKVLPGPAPQVSAAMPAGAEPNLVRVHADQVWALGYTGQGIVVAGQDTGYDWDHPALRDQYRGWDGAVADHDYNWHDAIHSGGGLCGHDSPEPCDDQGHGTHTMGTLVGDDHAGAQVGMAPGARWIGCRNMDRGVGTPATYLECFQFFLAPYPVEGTTDEGIPELAPDVVNNSWSCPPGEGCDADTLQAAVEALRQAGIVIVVSAGNSGSGCATLEDPPALYEHSFSIAAFDHRTDGIAPFSSRGPVTYGGETYVKPDIAAPGVGVWSCVPGGGYASMSGTSMAAPHVAGAVALLLSAAPGYRGQVGAIEGVLTASAEPRTTSQGCGGDSPTAVPNNVWGWGILDVLAAVQLATTEGFVQGTVTSAPDGTPLAGVLVTADFDSSPFGGAGLQAVSDASGSYALPLAAGTYDLTAQASGYLPQTIHGVVIVNGQVTTQDLILAPVWRLYLPLIVRRS